MKLSDNERAALERRVQGLSRELLKVQQLIASANEEPKTPDFGRDVYQIGTVVRFYKRYAGTDVTYTYVAIKFESLSARLGNRCWALSDGNRYSWDGLAAKAMMNQTGTLIFEVLTQADYAVQTTPIPGTGSGSLKIKTVPAFYWRELVRI